MNADTRIAASLAENLLTLLCFDDKRCREARAAVTPQLFESAVFREIAGAALDFIDQFGVAIKDHLPDHLEHILNGDDARKARTYKLIVTSLFENRDSVNSEYVLASLHKFVRQQRLKSGVIEAVEALEAGDIDKAELAVETALKAQVVSFEPGLNLSDAAAVTGLLDNLEEPGFDLGIKELDDAGAIPRRKELMLFIAPRGRGKSWFCTHVAKFAILQRWSTVVISLEMSEKRYTVRFLQSFFSISKRNAQVRVAEFVIGRNGELVGIAHQFVERATLKDDNITQVLSSKVRREFRQRKPLVVKAFPTGSLTVEMLEAYLEGLERHSGVTPDCIIVDYPDLMKHDAKNKRIELGQILENLRGIAVKRNAALVAVSQGNRESEKATTVTGDMAAEDISKLATADVVFTYSQTRPEKRLGLARILVEKSRNDQDKFSVLITQAYEIGQFCLDSVPLNDDYWDLDVADDEHEAPPKRRRRSQDED